MSWSSRHLNLSLPDNNKNVIIYVNNKDVIIYVKMEKVLDKKTLGNYDILNHFHCFSSSKCNTGRRKNVFTCTCNVALL